MIAGLGLLANGVLALGAWWLAGHGLGRSDRVDRMLAAAVVAACWSVLGMQVLGLAGWIAIGPLLGWSGLLLAAGIALKWRSGHSDVRPGGDDGADDPPGPAATLSLSLVLWTCAPLFMQSLLMPVKVVSDGPIYHLYFAVRWWKAGRLNLVAAPFGENAATYFPANGDLWFTWLVTSWGAEQLAKVGQVPFLAVAAIAAYGIARQLGIRRDPALIATSWFASVTPLLAFTSEANVDTIFTAAYLASAYFLLHHFFGAEGRGTLALAGLAAGLAMGTKPTGLVFVLPLLALALANAAVRARSRISLLRSGVVLLACALCMSGFWYVRNAIVTGNPLYPLQIELLGRPLFRGCYDGDAMRSSIYYIPVWDWRALVDILLLVVDPRLAILWLPAVLGAWALRPGPAGPRDRWVWAVSGLAVFNVALYWLAIPYRTQQRFMLHAMGLAVTPLACWLDRRRRLPLLATGLLAVHLLTPQSWPVAVEESKIPWDLAPHIRNVVQPLLPLAQVVARLSRPPAIFPVLVSLSMMLGTGLSAWLMVWSLGRATTRRRAGWASLPLRAIGLVGLLVTSGLSTGALGTDPRQRFYPPYPDFVTGWMNLDARSGPSGARIAYAGTNIPYYLFGVGLRNDVQYVNVDGHGDWLLHDYERAARGRGEPLWPNSRPGWDRARPDFDAWLGNLRAARIALLVVTVVNPGEGAHNIADRERFPIERQWADAHPEAFEPVYGVREQDRLFRIYALRRPDAS